MEYVRPAAMAPMATMRKALNKKLRPVKSEIKPPITNSDKAQTKPLAIKAALPLVMKYGITGIAAPHEKARNELQAAVQGDPRAEGSRPSSSRARVSIAVSGFDTIRLARSSASPAGMPFA